MSFKGKFLSIIAALLISSSALAQNDSTVVLPVPIAKEMFKDAKELEQRIYELNTKDSIIRVYEHKEGIYKEEIQQHKLNASSYEKIISLLDRVDEIRKQQLDDKDKELKRNRITLGAISLAELIIIILLII